MLCLTAPAASRAHLSQRLAWSLVGTRCFGTAQQERQAGRARALATGRQASQRLQAMQCVDGVLPAALLLCCQTMSRVATSSAGLSRGGQARPGCARPTMPRGGQARVRKAHHAAARGRREPQGPQPPTRMGILEHAKSQGLMPASCTRMHTRMGLHADEHQGQCIAPVHGSCLAASTCRRTVCPATACCRR
jgi:hypothetical protein